MTENAPRTGLEDGRPGFYAHWITQMTDSKEVKTIAARNELRRQVAGMFGTAAREVRIVRSPYRICPLGAHIDHQLGPVTGMALEHELLFGFVPRREPAVRVRSLNFAGEMTVDLSAPLAPKQGDWGDYLRGAVFALRRQFGELAWGLDGLVAGDSRIGGLSSSASVGCAYLLALESANDLDATPTLNVELDRMIENEYIGLHNGLLDQSMILLSRCRHLTHLDCRTGEHDLLPLPGAAPPLTVVVAYSGLSRTLIGTDYNRRVDECRTGARMLMERAGLPAPEPPQLGRVPEAVFDAHLEQIADPFRKRARHFITETRRVRAGVDAWRAGNLAAFGMLMNDSGQSSIDNYECGSPHLISLYRILRATPGVYGARFSGAGFRGCCIGLADPARAAQIQQQVLARYAEAHPDFAGNGSVYCCDSADAASVVE